MTTLDRFAPLRRAVSQAGGASSDFDLNAGVALAPNRKLREAAVLVPIVERDGRLDLLLTKRSSALRHHPGQISFPGGKRDAADPDLSRTALREAWEEVRLPPQNVEIIGELPGHETVTNFIVTPILARVGTAFQPLPDPGEVEEAFFVPLSHVLRADLYQIQSRRWQGQMRHYYVIPYGPYYIWGATARILRGLADRMGA